MQGYRDKIGSLGEYEKVYIEYAFEQLGAREITTRERVVMELLKLHVQDFAEKRRADVEIWLEAYRKRFDGFSDS